MPAGATRAGEREAGPALPRRGSRAADARVAFAGWLAGRSTHVGAPAERDEPDGGGPAANRRLEPFRQHPGRRLLLSPGAAARPSPAAKSGDRRPSAPPRRPRSGDATGEWEACRGRSGSCGDGAGRRAADPRQMPRPRRRRPHGHRRAPESTSRSRSYSVSPNASPRSWGAMRSGAMSKRKRSASIPGATLLEGNRDMDGEPGQIRHPGDRPSPRRHRGSAGEATRQWCSSCRAQRGRSPPPATA